MLRPNLSRPGSAEGSYREDLLRLGYRSWPLRSSLMHLYYHTIKHNFVIIKSPYKLQILKCLFAISDTERQPFIQLERAKSAGNDPVHFLTDLLNLLRMLCDSNALQNGHQACLGIRFAHLPFQETLAYEENFSIIVPGDSARFRDSLFRPAAGPANPAGGPSTTARNRETGGSACRFQAHEDENDHYYWNRKSLRAWQVGRSDDESGDQKYDLAATDMAVTVSPDIKVGSKVKVVEKADSSGRKTVSIEAHGSGTH